MNNRIEIPCVRDRHGQLHTVESAGVPCWWTNWAGHTVMSGRPTCGEAAGLHLPLAAWPQSPPEANRPGNRGPVALFAVPDDLAVGDVAWVVDHFKSRPDRVRVCRVAEVRRGPAPWAVVLEVHAELAAP